MVLMFTDIVGSVDLRRRIGDAAAAQIIRRHDDLFRRTVGAFAYAEILKDLGDGFLARFSSASDAVHAALHFQQTLRQEGCATFAAIHQGTTAAQREQAVRRLRAYQRDVRELMAQP